MSRVGACLGYGEPLPWDCQSGAEQVDRARREFSFD